MQQRDDIMSVDAMMDERYGKVGTPEREAFRKEAYAYCVGQIISDARKREPTSRISLALRTAVWSQGQACSSASSVLLAFVLKCRSRWQSAKSDFDMTFNQNRYADR